MGRVFSLQLAYLSRVSAGKDVPQPLGRVARRRGGAAAAVAQGPIGRLAIYCLDAHARAIAGRVYLCVLRLQRQKKE